MMTIDIRDVAHFEILQIDPEDLISGNPEARNAMLYKTPDGRTTVGLFTCTSGSFRYTFEVEEFIKVVRGKLVLRQEDGTQIELGPGADTTIAAGTRVEFDVREDLVDIYTSWTKS